MEIMRHTDEGRDNKMKKHSCIILFTMTLIMTMMLSVLTAFAAGDHPSPWQSVSTLVTVTKVRYFIALAAGKPYRMGFY